MTPVDFSRRSDALELMDADDSPEAELRETFRQLAFINRRLGGHAATLGALNALTPPGTKRLRILDAGCGDGDAGSVILDWAASRGIAAELHGIDLSKGSVALARERRRPGLSFSQDDLFSLDAGEDYDIVHAGLLLHHCPGDDAARALKAMHERARLGVAVNDLHRHPLAYLGIRSMTALFSGNRLIRHDAPLSVLRGFSRGELEALCRQTRLPAPEIRWRWAFRWQMAVPR
ncbi:MAG: SAM-dependent methyltransferase [Elusimicrobia bacterium CG_4_9_14_3_um_filter_62_55]|nr:MAG: SAM-dependent methyltransferase [Elusimicrobia bacterium CG22_combo_CG10-13_8_21_14_all_63_91]PJA16743.1 MAG: SAM-dependent methyltransferase [Elusimicrobia bacterium CG_4_10_14_0_2_um_filter_63_34]PJB24089.1 MAG: SAM-dependent methyltransferase [Elusimicrobia bacterium CG_4_9_14_3_um_filter_62_55]